MSTNLVSPVTDDSFESEVLRNGNTVLVDFWAPWCNPCKMLAPVLEELANEHSDSISIVKVDIDENPALIQMYKVKSIPTLMIFRDGAAVQTIVGGKSKVELARELAAHLV